MSTTSAACLLQGNGEDDAATPSTNKWGADGTDCTFLDPTPTLPDSVHSTARPRSRRELRSLWPRRIQHAGRSPDLTVGGRITHDNKDGELFIVNNVPTPYTFGRRTTTSTRS
jgi:iron complex outermembrane receptor protein